MTRDAHLEHVLQAPLLVHSGSPETPIGILPTGTTLRYVQSFPEGFDRYQIDVNVEGMRLDLVASDPPDRESPITALTLYGTPVTSVSLDDLQAFLQALGVTRATLDDIGDRLP